MAKGADVTLQSRAPDPSVDRIEELASRILKGDILLPKFQRDFVWEKKQIVELLDSVANNYPIGSVLLWRSTQPLKSERNIADLEIAPTQHGYPVNYLLDGQQRLSTICGALYWQGTDAGSRWNLAYDLREGKFLHLDSLDDPPLHQMRLNLIRDPAKFFKQVASLDTLQSADVPLLKQRADALFNRLKDYKIATVTLHDMSIDTVAPIFERINSKGTPLTMVDLMRAATWSEDFDLFDEIGSITTELATKRFGGIEKKTILRSISAAAGGGFSEASIDQLRKYDAKSLKEAVSDTKDAYLRSVDFLATDLSIPSDKQLPYANQLVVLSEVFRLRKNLSSSQFAELKRWFWRTAATGYFGGWNTGNMGSDQHAAAAFAAEKTSVLLPELGSPNPSTWIEREFRSNAAHSKILILFLCFHQPRDLLTGQKIDVAEALFHGNNKEFHHFFPRNYLKNSHKASVREANVLANIVMLTATSNKIITNRAPSDYLKQSREQLGSEFDAVLSSNLISQAALDCALKDDYKGYLRARAATVHDEVKKLAGW